MRRSTILVAAFVGFFAYPADFDCTAALQMDLTQIENVYRGILQFPSFRKFQGDAAFDKKIETAVKEYYGHVDKADFPRVMKMFTKDAIYFRDDATYSGKTKIKNFFTKLRKIQGLHTIQKVLVDGNRVLVKGTFAGTLESAPLEPFGFLDVWVFNEEGKVIARESKLEHRGL